MKRIINKRELEKAYFRDPIEFQETQNKDIEISKDITTIISETIRLLEITTKEDTYENKY